MKYLLSTILFATCVVTGFSQGQKDPAALTILESMSQKYESYPSFSADFTYTLINPDKSKEDITGAMTVKGEKYKLDLGDQEITNNGDTIWTYLKDVNEVNITLYYPEEQEITLSSIWSIYEDGYKYVYVEARDGGKTHVIDLEPEDSGKDIYKIRMEITDENRLLSFMLYERSGVQYLYTINNFDEKVNAQDDYFAWDKKAHPDVDVIDFTN